MTVDQAMKLAEDMGVTPATRDETEDMEEKIFNFGVYKYGKNKTGCSRRILQVRNLRQTVVLLTCDWGL